VNPARLAELNHQRALVQQQLAWLEREIARESGAPGATPATPVQPVPATTAPTTSSPSGLPAELEAYAPDPVATAADARRGCFLVAALALVLMIAALTAIYFWRYRDRPLLFPSSDARAAVSPQPK
jgi:hypothetical protein